MTFEELQKANSTLSTMDIKGKAYVLVNERIKAFRMLYPNGTISTELLSDDGNRCVFRAVVRDEEEHCLGTGHAYEVESSSYINKTSYIENCETSAVGRALAMAGIGIDTSVASYEEVDMAVKKQEQSDLANKPISDIKKQVLEGMCNQLGLEYRTTFPKGVTEGQYKAAADRLRKLLEKKGKA